MTAPVATHTDLPPDGFVGRWTAGHREAVCAAVVGGKLSAGDALRRWRMSVEELDGGMRAYRKGGRGRLGARRLREQRLLEQGGLL